MNAQEFCYWLQGFVEVAKPETINSAQLQEIKNHLALVLNPQDVFIYNTKTEPFQPNYPQPPIYKTSKPFPYTVTCSTSEPKACCGGNCHKGAMLPSYGVAPEGYEIKHTGEREYKLPIVGISC